MELFTCNTERNEGAYLFFEMKCLLAEKKIAFSSLNPFLNLILNFPRRPNLNFSTYTLQLHTD